MSWLTQKEFPGQMYLLIDNIQNLPPSASKRDIEASTNAARWAGFRVVHIEPDFERCETAEAALWMVEEGADEQPAFWLGYIPTEGRYREIYEALSAKGHRLPNSPLEHNKVMELDLAYPDIHDLTARTVVAFNVEEAVGRSSELHFPLFVKGAVQSWKSKGWDACVVNSVDELARQILRSESRTRGKIVLRELLSLRHKKKSGLGFPIGREYRVFLYSGEVVSMAYYWDDEDEFGEPTEGERNDIVELATVAANRLRAPLVAVDVGQDESGRWWVIETADGQFAGISQHSVLSHWRRLFELACRWSESR